VRYDFAQRLERSAQEFKATVIDRIEATVTGLATAVTRGTQKGQSAADSAQARMQAVAHALQVLDAAQAPLTRMLEQPR